MIKERPILFNCESVRALLNGSKTQTRMIWKMPKGCEWYVSGNANGIETGDYCDINGNGWWNVEELPCPHGKIGDRLWVRETWRYADWAPFSIDIARVGIEYKADEKRIEHIVHKFEYDKHVNFRPSIHMSRSASRILLEITNVRVERLNDISPADCISEGINLNPPSPVQKPDGYDDMTEDQKNIKAEEAARTAYLAQCIYEGNIIKEYINLWESINGKGSWDLNPYVWVIEFKVIK